jgi:hypothetical protein
MNCPNLIFYSDSVANLFYLFFLPSQLSGSPQYLQNPKLDERSIITSDSPSHPQTDRSAQSTVY